MVGTGVAAMPSFTDVEQYRSGNPFALWAAARRTSPVHLQEPTNHDAFWAVTTYEGVRAVLADPRQFSSANGTFLRPSMSSTYPGSGQMLTLCDPPRHTALRRALASLFTARAAARLRARCARVTESLLHAAANDGGCDFSTQIGARVSLLVMHDLLSIDAVDIEHVEGLLLNVSCQADAQRASEAHVAVIEHYASVLAGGGGSRNGILATLLNARAEGLEISDEEILLTCDNVLVGTVNTTQFAAAGGLLAVMSLPNSASALGDRAGDLDAMVEEILRWTSPVTHVLRTTTSDCSLLGQELPAGAPVALWLASANRDELVFDGADEFRPDRVPNRHLALGGGTHLCIGAALVKLLLGELFAALASFGTVTIAGDPVHAGSFEANGIVSLPIEFK